MESFKIGDKIQRITGDKQNRGEIVEIDEAAQRARIVWTHRQGYEFVTTKRNAGGEAIAFRTEWTGEFVPFESKQPRTWAAFKSLKVIK